MDTPSVSPDTHAEPPAAVVTTSILRSPVVHSILHAKIRNHKCNDVVFVGDRSIQVKQVREHGHLDHIVTKSDFDANIRAAKVFTIQADNVNEDEQSIIKKEDDSSSTNESVLPQQCLILTLDSNDIVFLYLRTDINGEQGLLFMHQTFQMPRFDRTLFQPGQHLAVDARSRAFAVAANEREIVIYAAKSTERIQHELRIGDPDWCPVSAERAIQVEGAIQKIDFLIPRSDDENHVILLVLVVHDRKTKAIIIDWQYASDIHHAQVHEALPLDQPPSAAGLLIPLRNAAFLIANGDEIKRFDNILTGSIRCQGIETVDEESLHPGDSRRNPMWTNWCRPERGKGPVADQLYLAREDGTILYLEDRNSVLIDSCNAGDMECHIGTAFASVGGLHDPDILVTAGDMSSGCIKHIGFHFIPRGRSELSRRDTMEMQFVESIPNWASVTDMMASKLPGKLQRDRDGLFVTSGRQPFGTVTELRYGLEAKLFVRVPLDDLGSPQSVWTLPLPVGHVMVILSGPAGTMFLRLENEEAEVELLEPSSLDSDHETLMAAVFSDGRIAQITTNTISVTVGTDPNFEDRVRIDKEPSDAILAAVCDIRRGIVITAERTTSANSGNALVSYTVCVDGEGRQEPAMPKLLSSVDLTAEPLAVACLALPSWAVTIMSNVEGDLEIFSVDNNGTFTSIGKTRLPTSEGGPGMCDSIVAIHPTGSQGQVSKAECLIACGLRDGRIFAVQATIERHRVVFASDRVLDFGQSSVRLTQPTGDSSIAYAMSGLDTCRLSWGGRDGSTPSIESIWMTDRQEQQLAQGAIFACTHTPPAHLLSNAKLADSVVFLTKDELLLGQLAKTPATVPRQVGVSGTPNRLLYLEQQRCMACASLRYDVRAFSQAPLERRQLWPVIDFIPSKSSAPPFSHDMQPSERVYALLEWSFRQDDDKVYSFLLVGGSYISARSDSTKGRITFLQPTNRNWEVTGVKEGRQMKFDAPAYALALLDPLTFVACSGFKVFVRRFDTEGRKWQDICEPFVLHSAGNSISMDSEPDAGGEALITVATAKDSAVVLRLESTMENGFDHRLVEHCTAPRGDSSLHHLTLTITPNDTTLLTTKNRKLIGLQDPTPNTHNTSSRILFEATLPQSLTRIRQANIRPRWKPTPPPGVLVSNIIGCSADGTLTGAMLINEKLWRRLSWLQRLCEWSEELSPHSSQTPMYSVSEQTFARNERGMPVGFGPSAVASGAEIVMRTDRRREQDRHVDGDVIGRVLEHGGVECLRKLVRQVAERRDAVGEWMRGHLDEELGAVEEMVEVVEVVVNGWL